MARRGVRESARDIERELRAQIALESKLDSDNAELAERVKAEVQSHVPIDQADAVGSIQIKKLKNTREHPLPGRLVYSDSPMFHMIEYGTKADPDSTQNPRRVFIDGQWVTLGPNTPTEAAAPFGKARARFGDEVR